MAMSDDYLKNTNVLRFYINDVTRSITCDYIENFDKIYHEKIKLSYEELRSLFRKYISDSQLYYEKKIYDKYILYNFYDVDIEEIDSLIERSRMNQQNDFNKFKPKNVKPTPKNNRKVTRKNKFNGKKVIATLGTIALLFALSTTVIDNKQDNSYINNNPNDAVITTEDINLTNDIEIGPEKETTTQKITYDQNINIYNDDDWTTSEKYFYARDNYYNLILKYSKMYGIDPQLALAIACHERGVHSTEIDKEGGLGLFQIQMEGDYHWDNQDVYAYNFETNSNEKYTIHKDEITNIENNIKAGLMIFQECLRRNDYDIAKSIQEYNFGYGSMQYVLQSCYSSENPETEDNKLEWLSHRHFIDHGDKKYLENVLKYIENDSVLLFNTKDGEIITCKYTNLSMNDAFKK